MRQIAALLGLCLCTACSYHSARPAPDPGGVRVVINARETELVHVRGDLARALVRRLHRDLGWSASESGAAELRITLAKETIRAASRDDRGVARAWQAAIQAQAQYTQQGQVLSQLFTSNASYRNLDSERSGLNRAAETLAESITDWLADVSRTLTEPATKP